MNKGGRHGQGHLRAVPQQAGPRSHIVPDYKVHMAGETQGAAQFLQVTPRCAASPRTRSRSPARTASL